MIGWNVFIWFGIAAVISGIAASVLSLCGARKSSLISGIVSVLILLVFIIGLWHTLERPPLRTTGETRLWYSFFASLAGLATYVKWRYKWIISFSTILASVFIMLNIFKPEIHDQTLMPALQSIWFIPHVTVYMFSYSLLGCAFLIACAVLFGGQTEIMKKQMLSSLP